MKKPLMKKFRCPYCHKTIETVQPKKTEVVRGKGYWDTLKKCIHCNELFFIKIYPSGQIKKYKLQGGPLI